MVFKQSLLVTFVAASLIASGAAHATNGYLSHGYGVKSMGMGGGGLALPNDTAMIIATNPAAITEIGNQLNFNISWFHPVRGYSQTGPAGSGLGADETSSGSTNFYIPQVSTSYAINDACSVGIALYGNGGMNTDFSSTAPSLIGGGNNGVFGPDMANGQPVEAGVDLEQMFVAPTYAHKFMDGKLSVGASLVYARQIISIKGLQNFDNSQFSTKPGSVTNNGSSTSTGWGGKIGVLYNATDVISLAGGYQTKMSMSKFGVYSGLFADGGKFDIPSHWTLGAAFKVAPAWTLTADFQRINYGSVKAIANPSTAYLLQGSASCGSADNTKCLGGSNGAGFGWSDVDVVKLGAQWQMFTALQLRVGFNHGTNPIGSQDVVFNTICPGVVKNHYTAGFTYNMNENQEINGAFMYAPTVAVSGDNTIPQALSGGTAPVVSTTIHMKQYEATVGYAYKF